MNLTLLYITSRGLAGSWQDFNEFDLTLQSFKEFDLTWHSFDGFDWTWQYFDGFDSTWRYFGGNASAWQELPELWWIWLDLTVLWGKRQDLTELWWIWRDLTELARTLVDWQTKKRATPCRQNLASTKWGFTELCQNFAPYFDGTFPVLDWTLQDLTVLDSTLARSPGL